MEKRERTRKTVLQNISKPYTFDRFIRLLIGIAIAVFVFLLINRLHNALLPFFIGWLLAYLLNPIVRFFQYKLKLKSRVLSITCTLLCFILIIVGVIALLVPLISKEVTRFYELIGMYTQNLSVDSFLPVVWQNKLRELLLEFDLRSIFSQENITNAVKQIAPKLWNILNSSISVILGFTVVLFVLLYLIFILLDYEKMNEGFVNVIPPKYRPLVMEIFHDLTDVMNRFFRGQVIMAFFAGILFAIGFSIIGLPLGIVLGLFIGVLNIIPYLQALGIPLAIFLGLLKAVEMNQNVFPILFAVALVFIIEQVIEQLFLVPKIMGKATGLNPAIILLSMTVWASLLGFIGMIIALPFSTVIISYYKRYVLYEKDDDHSDNADPDNAPEPTDNTPPENEEK
ncbi:MAG: AI-2E family transporter [Prevotellaceae bacterium]|jgi:predicted PurR-regulated permease PerM|nr:AI-2E family transporter [Prevotellaceae bacterium]